MHLRMRFVFAYALFMLLTVLQADWNSYRCLSDVADSAAIV